MGKEEWPAYMSLMVADGRAAERDKALARGLPRGVFETFRALLPRLCADIVFVNNTNQNFLLPTRIKDPEGPFMVGGTIWAREHPVNAAIRKLEEETGLVISSERLEAIWLRRFMFSRWDSYSHTYQLELTPEERDSVQLDSREYDSSQGLQSFSRADLIANGEREIKEGKESAFSLLVELWEAVFIFSPALA